MDDISFINASIFDNSMRIDIQTLKLAELIRDFFSLRISIIEKNNNNKDKNLLEIMDSMNMITDEVENLKKLYLVGSNIEEIELKLTLRSNSSSKINNEKDTKPQNAESTKINPSNKNNNNIEINSNLKSKKSTYISRSPDRLTNKLVLNCSPKQENKEVTVPNKGKGNDKTPIQEIVINNPSKTSKLGTIQENTKKVLIDRRGSPNQPKGSLSNNFNSNNTVNKNPTGTIKTSVKTKIEVISMVNPTRTGNCSPVNNQTKNVKIQQNDVKEKESKFRNDTHRKSAIIPSNIKSRSPEQKDINITKLIESSPPRISFEYQNNDTSVNSNEKNLKQEKNNQVINGELSEKRKYSNASNSCSNHEITKSMNNGNSSVLSSCNEVNISSNLLDKLRRFFNNTNNSQIFLHLYRFLRVNEKTLLKNINHKMRINFFNSEISQIKQRILLKKPEENPFYNFSLKTDLDSQIKKESLFLSDYLDDKNVLNSYTFINLVNMIYIMLYSKRSDSSSLTDKVDKIEDFILQIDFDRNIYSKITTLIRKLRNSIDIFHILRGVYDINQDNYVFNFDLPKKFDSLVKFAIAVTTMIEQGQNIEVVLDVEILNHKIDILRAYSDKKFDQ